MARRIYSLPRLDQLTNDQKRVLRLKKEGQYLVVGSPGTGKSVVALLRAREYADQDKSLFLTFNHVLSQATNQLSEGQIHCQTAMSWFYELYWTLTGGKAETFEQDKMPERVAHKPDYQLVDDRFDKVSKDFSGYQLIIDEGQDLPEGWYDCLWTLGFENFFVVADQNQQITEENSDKKQLKASLGIEDIAEIKNGNKVKKDDPKHVIALKDNFRNTTPIAIFANTFYTDKTSPLPDIPDRPSTDIPILYEFGAIDKISEMILSEYDRDPSKLIGFIVPTENKREWYAKKLGNDNKERSNPGPVISTYSSQQKGDVNIDFSFGGIVVLNDKSVKGIEFDTVFIILDDFKLINNDIERLQKRFYVMSSRAKEKLFLFRSAVRPSVVDDILPKEGDVFSYENKVTGMKVEEEIMKRRKI